MYNFEVSKFRDNYTVYLPHMCDNWEVTYGPKDQAIEEMEKFIHEAQEALEEELKNA